MFDPCLKHKEPHTTDPDRMHWYSAHHVAYSFGLVRGFCNIKDSHLIESKDAQQPYSQLNLP